MYAFDWYQNRRPWTTLNDLERPNARCAVTEKMRILEPSPLQCTNLNEDRRTQPATKM